MASKGYKKTITLSANFTEFTGSATDLSRRLAKLDSEFRAVSTDAKSFGTAADQLGAKTEYLTKKIEGQQLAVNKLHSEMIDAGNEFGANSKAAEEAAIKYNKASASLTKLEAELIDAEKAAKAYAVSLEKDNVQLENFWKRMNTAASSLQPFADKMKSFGMSMSMYVTLPIVAAGAAALQASVAAEETESAFEIAFGSMAKGVRQYTEQMAGDLKLNSYNLREMATSYFLAFQGMDIADGKAVQMSQSFVKLTYDIAALRNTKPELVMQSLMSGLAGQTEALRRLNIFINEATIKQTAYSNGLSAQGAELTQAQKGMAAYALIMDQASVAHDNLKNTQGEAAVKMMQTTEQLEEAMVKFGDAIKPALLQFLIAIDPIIESLSKMDANTMGIILRIGAFIAIVGPLLTGLASMVQLVSATSGALMAMTIPLNEVLLILGIVLALLFGIMALAKGLENMSFEKFWKGLQSDKVIGAITGKNTKVPAYATGTSNHPGGMALVGEDGPELVDLPSGSKVYPTGTGPSGGDTFILNVDMDDVGDVARLVQTVKQLKQTRRAAGAWG